MRRRFRKGEYVPKVPDKLGLASESAKETLLLVDTGKNGKISKQEWVHFMSPAFDRLDTKKNGELDPGELLQSNVTVQHVRAQDARK